MSDKKTNVAIFAVAQNIPKEITHRFTKCIEYSQPKVSYDVYLIGQHHPRKKNENFNKCKLLNKMIKKLLNMNYEVLIQSDIDLIVPPKLIDKSYHEAMKGKYCFHNHHRRITIEKIPHFPKLPEEYYDLNWNFLQRFPKENANGCWNALQTKYWMDTGGFNEDIVNWGRDDDDWCRRSKIYGKIEFIMTHKYPLIHVNHKPRTKDDRKRNDVVLKKAIKEGKINWLT